MKVSIIVPIYGVEKYIKKCACSLFEQTYSNIEFIFINDKTKDRSMEVLSSVISNYPKRKNQIVIINHPINKGLSQARETGIQASTGDYLIHVDSDDYVEKNMVEKYVNVAVSQNCDVVIGGFWNEYHNRSCIDCSIAIKKEKEKYLADIIKQDVLTPIWGKLIKSSLYKDHDIHCISGISFAEDYAVLPRILWYANKIGFINSPFYHYTHFNTKSLTNNFKMKDVVDKETSQKCIDSFFEERNSYTEEIVISNLKRRAWCLRAMLLSDYSIDECSTHFDKYKYRLSYRKYFSINHNIILFADNYKLYHFLILYLKISKKIMR